MLVTCTVLDAKVAFQLCVHAFACAYASINCVKSRLKRTLMGR
jgi:hypothetical protein